MTEPRHGHPGYGSAPGQPDPWPGGQGEPYSPAYEDSPYGQPPPPPPLYSDPGYQEQPAYQPAAPRLTGPPGWEEPTRPGQPPVQGGPPFPGQPPVQGAPPFPGQPPPQRRPPGPASRSRVRKVWITVRLVVAVAVLGVIAYQLVTHLTSHKPASSSAGRPSPSQSADGRPLAVSHTGDLRKYLIAAPAKSRPWPKPLGSAGKLTRHQAIQLSNSNRATFSEFRFRAGAVRSWITAGSTWVDMRLYKFRSAGDAQAFFRFDTHRSARLTPPAGRSHVKGVPSATVFAHLKADSDGLLSVLGIGVKGDVVYVADVAEHSLTPRLGVVKKLMREQYGKL